MQGEDPLDEVLYCNDPDDDFSLTLELTHQGEIWAIVRNHAGSLRVDVYPTRRPIRIPLQWLLERLQQAASDLKGAE